jgi:spore maturation protein CgeB
MFARRVFEYSLYNVNILTNYSKGVRKIFKDNVFEFNDMETLPDFNGDYEEKRLNNLYNVLENHTYTERWKQILDTMGFEYIEEEDHISIIYKIEDLYKLDDVIANFNQVDYPFITIVIVHKVIT